MYETTRFSSVVPQNGLDEFWQSAYKSYSDKHYNRPRYRDVQKKRFDTLIIYLHRGGASSFLVVRPR